jgi:hypothetical protein
MELNKDEIDLIIDALTGRIDALFRSDREMDERTRGAIMDCKLLRARMKTVKEQQSQ